MTIDPCGCIVEIARFTPRGTIYPFARGVDANGNPDPAFQPTSKPVSVKWYLCQPTAKPLPYPTPFTSTFWLTPTERGSAPGSFGTAGTYGNNPSGVPRTSARGIAPCGSREDWENGLTYRPNAPLPVFNPDGLPLCCIALNPLPIPVMTPSMGAASTGYGGNLHIFEHADMGLSSLGSLQTDANASMGLSSLGSLQTDANASMGLSSLGSLQTDANASMGLSSLATVNPGLAGHVGATAVGQNMPGRHDRIGVRAVRGRITDAIGTIGARSALSLISDKSVSMGASSAIDNLINIDGLSTNFPVSYNPPFPRFTALWLFSPDTWFFYQWYVFTFPANSSFTLDLLSYTGNLYFDIGVGDVTGPIGGSVGNTTPATSVTVNNPSGYTYVWVFLQNNQSPRAYADATWQVT